MNKRCSRKDINGTVKSLYNEEIVLESLKIKLRFKIAELKFNSAGQRKTISI